MVPFFLEGKLVVVASFERRTELDVESSIVERETFGIVLPGVTDGDRAPIVRGRNQRTDKASLLGFVLGARQEL